MVCVLCGGLGTVTADVPNCAPNCPTITMEVGMLFGPKMRLFVRLIVRSCPEGTVINTGDQPAFLLKAAQVAVDVSASISSQGFHELAISVRHGAKAGALPGPHQDPFDRMLVAQAQVENLTILTADSEIARYPVRVER